MAIVEVDGRGLEPAEPIVRILAALAALPPRDELIARLDREPLLLFPELVRRGYEWSFSPSEDWSHFVVHVKRVPGRTEPEDDD